MVWPKHCTGFTQKVTPLSRQSIVSRLLNLVQEPLISTTKLLESYITDVKNLTSEIDCDKCDIIGK